MASVKKALGRPPKPDYTAKNIFIAIDLIAKIQASAIEDTRTFSSQVEVLLAEAFSARESKL